MNKNGQLTQSGYTQFTSVSCFCLTHARLIADYAQTFRELLLENYVSYLAWEISVVQIGGPPCAWQNLRTSRERRVSRALKEKLWPWTCVSSSADHEASNLNRSHEHLRQTTKRPQFDPSTTQERRPTVVAQRKRGAQLLPRLKKGTHRTRYSTPNTGFWEPLVQLLAWPWVHTCLQCR